MKANSKIIGLCFLSAMALPAQENSYIDSTRPTISSDASIQQKGVLQIESGYDAYFLPYDQTGAVSLYYSLTNWLRLDASVSAWRATDVGVDHRTEGVGNAEFGTKIILFHDGRSKTIPGVAVEYEDSAASASEANLRSRYHQGTLIFSNTAGPWKWKLNGSLIASNCRNANGCRVL